MWGIQFGELSVMCAAAMTLGAAEPRHRQPGDPGCDVNSAHATKFLASTQSMLPKLDAPGAQRLGWQRAPSAVMLVTQSAKCDSIIAAHNAYVSKSPTPFRLTVTAIVQANNSYLLEVTPANGASENMIFVYDSALKFRVVY